MPLNTKFSLTPLEPYKYLWDSVNSCNEYYAYILHYGAYIGITSYSLETNYNDNKVCIATNYVGYPFPDPFPADYSKRAVACLRFYTDASTDEQHLLLFHVNCYGKIGVYLNGNLVREEDCDGDETIAVLVDSPGPGVFDTMYIVPSYSAWIKGVDCYVV